MWLGNRKMAIRTRELAIDVVFAVARKDQVATGRGPGEEQLSVAHLPPGGASATSPVGEPGTQRKVALPLLSPAEVRPWLDGKS